MNEMESQHPARLFISAGEESGDHHGADLVKALRSRRPDLTFTGIGGENMEGAGVDIVWPSRDISVVGIVEVLEKAPSLLKAYRRAKQTIKEGSLTAAVFIDFPDFNLKLAQTAKNEGIPVFYYISPQVWAWRKGRVRKISRIVDRMLVILPFEESFYKEHGVEVDYVGHPLADRMKSLYNPQSSSPRWEPDHPTIGLMPGSRKREIVSMLPHMLKAAKIIKSQLPGARLVLILGGGAREKTARKMIAETALNIEIKRGPDYEAMASLNYLIVASGTATLEAGLLRIPMVIIYRGNFLSWLIVKALVRVPHMGLPNLVAGSRLVPELRQYEASAKEIARQALKVLKDRQEYENIVQALNDMALSLQAGGAADRAAEVILSRLWGEGME